MNIISVKNLSKTFKKPLRKEGLGGMVKSLFSREYEEVKAVDDISLTIRKLQGAFLEMILLIHLLTIQTDKQSNTMMISNHIAKDGII